MKYFYNYFIQTKHVCFVDLNIEHASLIMHIETEPILLRVKVWTHRRRVNPATFY